MKTETDGIFATQILVNAIDEEGARVHIADVVKGDGRVYRCPSPVCGHQVLVPKKGEILRHHFAHKSGRRGTPKERQGTKSFVRSERSAWLP